MDSVTSTVLKIAVITVVVSVAGGSVAGAPAEIGSMADAVGNESTGPSVTELNSCGVIDQPGRYRLTTDLNRTTDEYDTSCIHVKSGNVILDGDGHSIEQSGPEAHSILVLNGSAERASMPGDGPSNVSVRDVKVVSDTGIATGHHETTVRSLELRNVTAPSNGDAGIDIEYADDVTMRNVTATDSRVGIRIAESSDVTVRDVTLTGMNDTFPEVDTGLEIENSENIAVRDIRGRDNDRHVSFSGRNVTVSEFYFEKFDEIAVRGATRNGQIRDGTVVAAPNESRIIGSITGQAIRKKAIETNGETAVENVTVRGNATAYEGPYDRSNNASVEQLKLDNGVVASFGGTVGIFGSAEREPTVPNGTVRAGPGVEVKSHHTTPNASVRFPYSDRAVGNESNLTLFVRDWSEGYQYGRIPYFDEELEWNEINESNVDTDNQTISTTVRRNGTVIPVLDRRTNETNGDGDDGTNGGDENGTDGNETNGDDDVDDLLTIRSSDDAAFVYGFVANGDVTPTAIDGDEPDDERYLVREWKGKSLVLGLYDDEPGDAFTVDGTVRAFAHFPTDRSVTVEYEGEENVPVLPRDLLSAVRASNLTSQDARAAALQTAFADEYANGTVDSQIREAVATSKGTDTQTDPSSPEMRNQTSSSSETENATSSGDRGSDGCQMGR